MILNKRRVFRFLKFVIILLLGTFVLNWFLTYQLQNKLRNILSDAVSNATDGFYQLTYDHLSIGLFNGELEIKGLDIRPDSAVFAAWLENDSLPATYLELNVKRVEFKGLNLVWLLDRSNLHFDLFEIDSPIVQITNPIESDRREKKSSDSDSKTLYEMVSPYLNEVSVKKLNLVNADILFVIKDSVESSTYALRDASFQAYDFLLDENSSESGKLLFSDNFEFTAEKEQHLLSDPQFLLKAGSIRLSTRDSIISIKDIILSSKYKAMEDTVSRKAGTYVDAMVGEVDAQGIWLKRENYLNFLNARSFKLIDSDIHYIVIDGKEGQKKTIEQVDTVSEPWSLYEIISPILYDVAIDKIGLDDAGFRYTHVGNEETDYYTVNRLGFRANGFHLDSLSDVSNRFMYSMNYKLDVTGMQAEVNSVNHTLTVDSLLLDTENGDFSVKNIQLKPIETRNRYDYIEGGIDSITMTGLDYALQGIYADRLAIINPAMRYVRNVYSRLPVSGGMEEQAPAPAENTKSTFDDFVSFVNDLKIKDILVRKGDFFFDDNHAGERTHYKLRGLNFYAKDFEINEGTRNSLFGFFDCTNLGFDFNNFDNYVFGKDYRLKIGQARFSHRTGTLDVKGIGLIPQPQNWKTVPEQYYHVDIPLFKIEGLFNQKKQWKVSSVSLQSPAVEMVKTGNSTAGKRKSKENDNFVGFMEQVSVNDIYINNSKVRYKDLTKGDSLASDIYNFHLKNIGWDNRNGNVIGLADGIISDIMLHTVSQSVNTTVKINGFTFTEMKWKPEGENTYLNIDRIGVDSPAVSYSFSEVSDTLKPDSTQVSEKKKNDIYTQLGGISDHIAIRKFDLTDGSFNYMLRKDNSPVEKLSNLNVNLEGIIFDKKSELFDIEDIRFSGSDLSFPLDNGFYTLKIGKVNINKYTSEFNVGDIHLLAKYPKMEFAYRHPKNKDWFDVTAGNVSLKGLDFNSFFTGKAIKADELDIDKVMLQNFKNQQIEVPHRIMPMIYETIQKAPLPIDIKKANVKDFTVIYDELPKNKNTAGVLSFIGMNGYITGLTNIVRYPDQYIRLDADGKFMGNNPFTAIWMIPVDSLHDCFYLGGHIERFDLSDLNVVTEPLANVRVEKGIAKDTKFDFEASSYSAYINMRFLYNDLKINILKTDGEENPSTNKFVTGLANLIISSNNPRNPRANPKTVELNVIRNPYHSTFNYFWQILQPAMGESVGVSQKTQNFGKKVAGFFNSIKNFFSPGKKKNEGDEKKENK